MPVLMNSAWHIAASAVLISLFALESEAGEERVNLPKIRNWWVRPGVDKPKEHQPFISANYYYPYLCSIIFYNKTRMATGLLVGEWVSACTIFSRKWVAFSIDNMDRPSDDHAGKFHEARYHHTIYYHDLQVVHGTVYGSPSKEYKNKLIKKHGIEHLSYLSSLDLTPRRIELPDDKYYGNWNISKIFKRNPIGGTETGVAFARVQTPFVWDSFSLPAPFISNQARIIKDKVEGHIQFLEEETSSQKSCYVGAYHRFTKKMKWFQVMYIPHDECREVYCTYDSRACLEFPKQEYHVCFKSLVYGDLCPEDRGTAVYCPDFSHSIFGILTTAPNCGWKNLPNVYTRIDVVHNKIWQDAYRPEPQENVRVYKYPDDLKQYTLLPPGMVRGP